MAVVLVVIPVAGIVGGRWLAKRQQKLEAEWEKFQEHRKELYAAMADSQSIEADFERSARLTESRTTAPREDAGPPAKVYRPPLRGVKPASWRARNPNEQDQRKSFRD